VAERPDLRARIATQREQRAATGRTRVRRTITRRDGMRCEVSTADGTPRWLLNFCSNDYLGLSQQFAVVAALQDTAAREGVGSTASHLVCGHHAIHDELERELADWIGAPRALLFGSGFLANLAVVQALLGDDDLCVQDRLNHASLVDAARLAGCRLRRYPHADADGALRQLRGNPDGAALLVTDGVFSMDGDIAPLRELALAAQAQHALLYVDDAHGVGVVGHDGRGSVAAARLSGAAPLQLVTLGKALGGYGAAVLGDTDVIEHLAETARPYLYTTALPSAQAAASLAAVKLARREGWRRDKLLAQVAQFRRLAARNGLELLPSDTPIQPLLCGSDAQAVAMAAALEEQGFWVAAIRPPTVPEGRARLRVTLSTLHAPEDIEALVDALSVATQRVGIAPVAALPDAAGVARNAHLRP
jgi:8-amino-7-oxononanoate synthase